MSDVPRVAGISDGMGDVMCPELGAITCGMWFVTDVEHPSRGWRPLWERMTRITAIRIRIKEQTITN